MESFIARVYQIRPNYGKTLHKVPAPQQLACARTIESQTWLPNKDRNAGGITTALEQISRKHLNIIYAPFYPNL